MNMWGLVLMFFNKMKNSYPKGVTLIEVLLVLVISSIIMVMLIGFLQQQTDEMRRSRAVTQIVQILNAGLAYYVANNAWPQNSDLSDLISGGYLPFTPTNPWGNPYTIQSSNPGMLTVTTNVHTRDNALQIVGRVPFGSISGTNVVSSSVNIPAQQLNNSTTLNFASIYHSGACVPAPVCPLDKYGNKTQPQIYVIPLSVSGVYDDPNALSGNCTDPNGNDFNTCSNINVFPITNYTAYAIGPVAYTKGSGKIQACNGASPGNSCYISGTSSSDEAPSGSYWRVCLSVGTEKGLINPVGTVTNNWAQGQAMGTLLVVTRCAISGEYTGAGFDVWQN